MTKWESYFGKWSKYLNEKAMYAVMQVLDSERAGLCPAFQDIFKAFQLCELDNLKIVILGMDPYIQKDVATGLAFANKKDTSESQLSPSLKVLREACIDYTLPHINPEFDVTLESWAGQGILLLNSALTTIVGRTGAHTMLWRPVISEFLSKLSRSENAIVYMLFGEQAKTFMPYIDTKYNFVLVEKHPAYYARFKIRMPSDIFHIANNIMVNLYGEPIKFFKENENKKDLQD